MRVQSFSLPSAATAVFDFGIPSIISPEEQNDDGHR